jgi:CheY-like chemotaxis protein
MNGYDVCREMRKQPWGRNAYLVALTGWGQAEDQRKASEAGFDRHLVKPVEESVLQKLLDERR